MTGSDNKVDEVKGTRATGIPGENVREYRQRVRRIEGDTS